MSGWAGWSVLFSSPGGSVLSVGGSWALCPPATSNTGSTVGSGVSRLCHRGGLWPVLSRAGRSLVGGGPMALDPASAGIFGLPLRGLLVPFPPVSLPWRRLLPLCAPAGSSSGSVCWVVSLVCALGLFVLWEFIGCSGSLLRPPAMPYVQEHTWTQKHNNIHMGTVIKKKKSHHC